MPLAPATLPLDAIPDGATADDIVALIAAKLDANPPPGPTLANQVSILLRRKNLAPLWEEYVAANPSDKLATNITQAFAADIATRADSVPVSPAPLTP